MSDVTIDHVATQRAKFLVVVLTVVLALAFISVVLAALVYSVVNQQADQLEQDRKNNERTECIRTINNEVNDQRWDYVYNALAAEDDSTQTQSIQAGRALKGEIVRRVDAECPPAVIS